jgi:hypothetical protein
LEAMGTETGETMSIDLVDYQNKAEEAVKVFWRRREAARQMQIERGSVDQGERAGVTVDGFLSLMKDIVHKNGLEHADICLKGQVLTLPGYFRPTKLWDMLVLNGKRLVAAIELKSQVGPSFGNNFNNRTEEAIGASVDLWTAYREGAFGDNPRPFVGWMILVEDCDDSRSPVRGSSPHFPIFPEFDGSSYADRYNILCRKLVQEQLYTAATLLLAPRSAVGTGEYTELSELTSLKTFVSTLAGHVAAEAARAA